MPDDQLKLFINLGSGQATGLGVGNKGALLDRAAQAGLPVPPGIILLDAAWQHLQNKRLVQVMAQNVAVPEPLELLPALKLPHFGRSLAIRSAFSAEDQPGASLAGFFTSKLFIDPNEPVQVARALAEVWASALQRQGDFRRDILMMEMVEAVHAGVAFTEREFEDDQVNYTTGTAETLVSGAVAGEALDLPKLDFWQKPRLNKTYPPFAIRLQRLLRQIRREFGVGDWDIEWADDGRCCWLIQIRPITRPIRRNEAFTLANMKEILPELPSPFMTSVIASCAGGLFAYYRRFDAGLPSRRAIIEIFYGRPFFNLSLLTEMMRRWGLPTRLVTGSIGGEADQEYGLNLGRFLRKAPVLLRLGLAQLLSVTSAKYTIHTILARTEQPGQNFTECIETLRWLFTTLVTEMFSLTAAMSGPLLLLRWIGVLAEHNARQRTISTQMFTDLEPLRLLAMQKPAIRSLLQEGQLPDDLEFRQIWAAYLKKHGHRGVYESDIARPRLHEAPEAVLASLASPSPPRRPPPHRTWLGWLTLPLWQQAARTMQAREQLRYTAMLGFDRIRRVLLKLAQLQVDKGHLPNLEALWLLNIEEVRQIDSGWAPPPDFFVKRRQEITGLTEYRLPDLFHRFDDLENYDSEANITIKANRLRGVSLTTGEVQGQAWVLSEPHIDLPANFTPQQTILVARSVDAGWIPTFARVAGVVVEIGGDLSHGSIILREIGLPAITNVRGVTQQIRTGDRVLLRASIGTVERI
jgi:pyruvate,water dikinase